MRNNSALPKIRMKKNNLEELKEKNNGIRRKFIQNGK